MNPVTGQAHLTTGQQSNLAGILGPLPTTHDLSRASTFQPMDLPTFFNTLQLHTPDSNWYMDTGASSIL